MTDRPLIGLIGFGAIGQQVLKTLSPDFRFAVLLRQGSPAAAGVPRNVPTVAALAELLALRPALVIEAAGGAALTEAAPTVLEAGVDLVVASTGALADPTLLSTLLSIATRTRARIVIPAGALGGLDYLGSLADLDDAAVVYTSRKPPAAWTSELAAIGHADGRIREAVTLFEGSAEDAARLYPKNLNAGLTVALAVGGHRMRVRVVADPDVSLNTHEIEAKSAAGTAFLRFANEPSPDNPKTSAITALSLAAAVRRRFSPLIV